MEIGQKIVVHDNLSSWDNSRPDHIVVLTITDKRKDVPYMFGNGIGDGYKAVDNAGAFYQCHWNSYPDDAMNPNCLWVKAEEAEEFWEICDSSHGLPFRPKFLDGEIGTILEYCAEHECLYYKDKTNSLYTGCFGCYLDTTYPNSEERAKQKKERDERKAGRERWVGWK